MEPETVDQAGSRPTSRPSRVSKAAERSCAVCHRRKVRCDKKMPCSTCTRTGVLCCYPPEDHQVLRHPRSSIADITSRLAQLERTVMALSGSSSAKESIERLPRESGRNPTGTTTKNERRPPDDEMLVPSGDSTHYISDVLLSRVLEEVRFRVPLVNTAVPLALKIFDDHRNKRFGLCSTLLRNGFGVRPLRYSISSP